MTTKLETEQVTALAVVLGYIEGRIDIATLQAEGNSGGARLAYAALDRHFPELRVKGLIDDDYLPTTDAALSIFLQEPPC